MLGKCFNVNIYGTVAAGVYTGYIENRSGVTVPGGSSSVIVFARSDIAETINGMVIATVLCDDGNTKFIISPVGDVYYEPEIAEKLSHVYHLQYKRISCLYEKSCGAVVFFRNHRSIDVLLVKNKNGKYWSFPKGHIEKGENEHSTTLREIKEETGLDVTIYDHYRQTSDYVPFGKIKKRVVFFLAEAKSNCVHIQQNEIDSYTWVTFEQAKKMCRYDNDMRVLSTAYNAIIQHDAHTILEGNNGRQANCN